MSLNDGLDEVGTRELSRAFRATIPEGIEIFPNPKPDFDQAYEDIQKACKALKDIIVDTGQDTIAGIETLREAVNSGELTQEEALPYLEGFKKGLDLMKDARSNLVEFSSDLKGLGLPAGECSIDSPAPLPPQ